MSEVWLGTIGPAYGNEEFWATAFEEYIIEDILREELIQEWGHEDPVKFEAKGNEFYTYHSNGDKAEIRKVALFD